MSEIDPIRPVTYGIVITHHWNGDIDCKFENVGDEPDDQRSVAHGLRVIADRLEAAAGAAKPVPNVIPVKFGASIATPDVVNEPNTALTHALADVFALARDGKLRSFAGTGFVADGARLVVWGGDLFGNVFNFMGALNWLAFEYARKVDEQPEGEG